MKNLIIILVLTFRFQLLTFNSFAQAPQKMSYQAVIRNSSNALIVSTAVGIKISILQGSSSGTPVFVETHTTSTNANGLASLEIGAGAPVAGTFAGINWAAGPYFIKTETDPTGGTNYTIAGTNQLISVPYALYSANGTAGAVGPTGAAGADGTNGINGTNGSTGATGTNGTDGSNGAIGATGAAGIDGINGSIGATGTTGTTGLLSAGTAIGNTTYWNGSQWVLNSNNIYNAGASVGINTGATPAASAYLDISGTAKGFLPPRMTTAQRNAIVSPAEALLIYNTTTQCYEGYNATTSAWVAFGCIGCQLPGAFGTYAASSIAGTSFFANWTICADASAYFLDVATDSGFTSFVAGYNNFNVGNVFTSSVTGLAYGTYYYRVRAINACGTSANSGTITVTINFTCGGTLPITHTVGALAPESKSVNYGTVTTSLSGASKCWITQNLGSTNQASSATDTTDAAAGWYWQFNRKQGYKVGPTPAWTITSITETSDWLAANDPCTIELGTGWRIPTQTEWTKADANEPNASWDNYTDAYNSVLKLHAAGYLTNTNGAQGNRGDAGFYWSSAQIGPNGWNLVFSSGGSYVPNNPKAEGFPLRCLRD